MIREAVIHRGAKRIDIGPRALIAACILLDRRVSMLEHYSHGMIRINIPCATKVKKFDLSVIEQHDVIRTDIPVNHAPVMHCADRRKQGSEHGQKRLSWDTSLVPYNLSHGFSRQIFHHDISSSVFLKEIRDPYNLGNVVKPGYGARLIQKAISPVLEKARFLSVVAGHI